MKAASPMTGRATPGWSGIGRRCDGVRDWRAPGRTNVIGALIGRRLLTVGLFQADINADIFRAWMEQDLSPKLPPACVIVIDNAAFHKRADIQSVIRNAGHTLEYLPAYSPDLNPVERKWAHLKSIRKQTAATIQDLFKIESFYVT
jgi:transposase